MSLSFIPWILSWIFINRNLLLGVIVPLSISIGIIVIKRKAKSIIYFEKINVLYFAILLIIGYFGDEILANNGSEINYFAMALIWLNSVFDNKPLTADYLKYRYDISIEKNPVFIKTNNILILFWSGIFVIQGIIYITLKSYGYFKITLLLYLLIFVALKFTNRFSMWYPKKIASGNSLLE